MLPGGSRVAAARKAFVALAAGIVLLGSAVAIRYGWLVPVRTRLFGGATVADRVAEYGPAARSRLAPAFDHAGVPYPPERFVIAAFKLEKEVHLLAAGPGQPLAFVKSYPILAASGDLGPKLREADGQVPEGSYGIESLNPNSRFHLALRVSYPNADDLARAARDGRTRLGGDIMIHGDAVSRGCLAMGDPAAEELFVLAAEAGLHGAGILISPVDFRRRKLPPEFAPPVSWAADLYAQIEAEVLGLPFPQ